ncbi:MAG TPA: hypothetical protein VFD41_08035 [Actinomycetales bacterium]|nr:hypothetical protein [Actinomycetales bacterium]
MSVPGEQPPFYAQPAQQPYTAGPAPAGYGQVQPYGAPPPPSRNVPVAYGQGYPPPSAQNAAALAILGRKSGGLAAVLSILLVGAGQMYCGHVGRGLAFLGGSFVAYLLMFVTLGFLFFLPLGIFIWALVDAVGLANRHNAELARRLSLGPAY